MAVGRGLAVVMAAMVCLQAASAQNARRLHSYFPDPTADIDNKLNMATSLLLYKPTHDSWVDPMKPSLATLLAKPPSAAKSIFQDNGQTRRLRSYFPDPTEDINNKLGLATSLLKYKPEMHDSWVDPKPSLATLLAKPDKGMGMHDSILASTNGQTRKLRSYFPDPTMDIDNKLNAATSILKYKPEHDSWVDPKPSLATLLAKPNMGMKDSIFASTNGQTRKLRSYFPDPTMDIDNKLNAATSILMYKPQHDSWVDPKPSLATLLAKPDKPMHESIFAMNGGQTRKLQSYFPDPTMDIDNKLNAATSILKYKPEHDSWVDPKPSLATLLAKPNMGMKDSIFASTNGQTRKLRSYFPDPTMDIDNKLNAAASLLVFKPKPMLDTNKLAAATTLLESQLIKGNIHKEANPYKPSLASLLMKPKMGMHENIFEYNGGNKRKLHSYFPDPTMDIDNKLGLATSLLKYKPDMHDSWVDPKPVLATLLAKPDKGMDMHGSIFATNSGQTRKLRSYLPDDHDISGKLGVAASLILTKPAYAPDSTHDILSKPAYAPDTLKDTLGWKASSPDSHSRRLRSYLPDDHDISGKLGAAASLILTKPAYAPDSTHDILSKPAYAPDTLKDTLGWKASSPDSHSRHLLDLTTKVNTDSSLLLGKFDQETSPQVYLWLQPGSKLKAN